MDDLIVSFPAGPSGMVRCVPFGIVDDDIALEGNETFQFDIVPVLDITPRDPSSALVTIIETDLGKVDDLMRYEAHFGLYQASYDS